MNVHTRIPADAVSTAVLHAAHALNQRYAILNTVNGPFRCWQCDTSRVNEIDHCDACGEVTGAYADRGML